jgi:hypothetical protein
MVKWLSCLPSKQAARVRFPFGVITRLHFSLSSAVHSDRAIVEQNGQVAFLIATTTTTTTTTMGSYRPQKRRRMDTQLLLLQGSQYNVPPSCSDKHNHLTASMMVCSTCHRTFRSPSSALKENDSHGHCYRYSIAFRSQWKLLTYKTDV